MAYRSRNRPNHRPNNNYCAYNSPGYGYGLGSCNNYSSGYSGNSSAISWAGNGGNRSNAFSSTGYSGGLISTGDEYTFMDCNELGRDLRAGNRKAWKACLCMVLIPTAVMVAILVFTGALLGGVLGATSNRSGSSSTTERVGDPSVLTSGFTRDVSFGNAFFCNEVTLEANGSRGAGASVYLITDTPPLTRRNSFTRRIRSGSVRCSWKYRLYSGTKVTTSLYMSRTLYTGTFTVYKSGSRGRPIATSSVGCTIGYSRRFTFRVQDEADYYFVYQKGRYGIVGLPCRNRRRIYFELQLNISASWFVHSTAGLTNAPNCSATTGRQCSLHVPADPNYRALIVTDLPSNNSDFSENISIRLQCSSIRGWAYAVVVLVPLLLVVGITITIVILLVVCCCYCWRKRRASRQSHNTHSETTTTEEAATTSGVQLQEMDPQQPATNQKDNKTTSDSQKDEKQHNVLTAAPPPSYKDSLDYPAHKSAVPPPYSKE